MDSSNVNFFGQTLTWEAASETEGGFQNKRKRHKIFINGGTRQNDPDAAFQHSNMIKMSDEMLLFFNNPGNEEGPCK